jgi:hypothetical protein
MIVPLFSIVLFQLAYCYTWTCAPMIPVCALQDWTESISSLLPLSLEVPDELKRLDRHCLDDSACGGSDGSYVNCLALRRYPPQLCLKSCLDAPFSYVVEEEGRAVGRSRRAGQLRKVRVCRPQAFQCVGAWVRAHTPGGRASSC